MRVVALVLFSIFVSGAGFAGAQSEPAALEGGAPSQERPEEIVVRGRRLAEFRVEVEQARVRAYEIFNEINTNDEFDVRCRKASRAGTNVPQEVCRAQFEDRISSRAAQEYMAAMRWVCPLGVTQDCIFSDASSFGISAAQAVEGEAPNKRKQLNQEIVRLANEDDRFAEAILDFYDASLRHEEERKRPRERTRER